MKSKKIIKMMAAGAFVLGSSTAILTSTSCGSKDNGPTEIKFNWEGSTEIKGNLLSSGSWSAQPLSVSVYPADKPQEVSYAITTTSTDVSFNVDSHNRICWSTIPNTCHQGQKINFTVTATSKAKPSLSASKDFILLIDYAHATSVSLNWDGTNQIHEISGYINQEGYYESKPLTATVYPTEAQQNVKYELYDATDSAVYLKTINEKQYIAWRSVSAEKTINFKLSATSADGRAKDIQNFRLNLNKPDPTALNLTWTDPMYTMGDITLYGKVNEAESSIDSLIGSPTPSYAKTPEIEWSISGQNFIHVTNGKISWDAKSTEGNYSFTVTAKYKNTSISSSKQFVLVLEKVDPQSISLAYSEGSTVLYGSNKEGGESTGVLQPTVTPTDAIATADDVSYQIMPTEMKSWISVTNEGKIKWSQHAKGQYNFYVSAYFRGYRSVPPANLSFTLNIGYAQPETLTASYNGSDKAYVGEIYKAGESLGNLTASVEPSAYIDPNTKVNYQLIATNTSQQPLVDQILSVSADGKIQWKRYENNTPINNLTFTARAEVEGTTLSKDITGFSLTLNKPQPKSIRLNWNGQYNIAGTKGVAGATTESFSVSPDPTYADFNPADFNYDIIEKSSDANVSINASKQISWDVPTDSSVDVVSFKVKATSTKTPSLTVTSAQFSISFKTAKPTNVVIGWSENSDASSTIIMNGTVNENGSSSGHLISVFEPSYSSADVTYTVEHASGSTYSQYLDLSINDQKQICWTFKKQTQEIRPHVAPLVVKASWTGEDGSTKTVTKDNVQIDFDTANPTSMDLGLQDGATTINGLINKEETYSKPLVAQIHPDNAEQKVNFSIIEQPKNGPTISLVDSVINTHKSIKWSSFANPGTYPFKVKATSIEDSSISRTIDLTLVLDRPDPTGMQIEWNGSTSINGTINKSGYSQGQSLSVSSNPEGSKEIDDATWTIISATYDDGESAPANSISIDPVSKNIVWNPISKAGNIRLSIKATSAKWSISQTRNDITLVLDYPPVERLDINWTGSTDYVNDISEIYGAEVGKAGKTTETLSATLHPSDASDEVNWSIENTSVPGVEISINSLKQITWNAISTQSSYTRATFDVVATCKKNTQIRSVKHFALNIEIKPTSISIIWPGSNQILGVENKAGSYKNTLAVSAQGNNPSTNVKWDILNPDVEDVLYIENNILSWNAVPNTTHIRFTLKATSTVDSSIVATMDLELYITENDPYVATRTELNGPEEPEWDFSMGENDTDEFGITIFSNEITADTQPEDVFVYLNFSHINVRDSSTDKSFYVDDITYAPGLTPVNFEDWGIKITKIGDDGIQFTMKPNVWLDDYLINHPKIAEHSTWTLHNDNMNDEPKLQYGLLIRDKNGKYHVISDQNGLLICDYKTFYITC